MCIVLDITRSNYNKYRSSEDKDYYDYLIIKEIFDESKSTYGFRRVLEGLKIKYGVIFNHKKVSRIMNKYGLIPKHYKEPRNLVNKKRIEDNVKDNLLKRNFNSNEPNQKWCTDVTYLIHNGQRAYLSSIIDLYDRKIVSYEISKRNDNKLIIDTLLQAIAKRKDVSGVTLHSDQGFQYTSYEYRAICEAKGIQISMSRKGSPVDNSPIESWHSLLKKEVLYTYTITSLSEYIALVEEWIEFYNTSRIRNKKK
jgi:putative transposase